MKLTDISIKAVSGQKYKFAAFPIDSRCRELAGVYIVTHRERTEVGEAVHHFLSVGETDNLNTWRESLSQPQCWTEHEANCLGILFEPDFQNRLRIVQDIRESFEFPCD